MHRQGSDINTKKRRFNPFLFAGVYIYFKMHILVPKKIFWEGGVVRCRRKLTAFFTLSKNIGKKNHLCIFFNKDKDKI